MSGLDSFFCDLFFSVVETKGIFLLKSGFDLFCEFEVFCILGESDGVLRQAQDERATVLRQVLRSGTVEEGGGLHLGGL